MLRAPTQAALTVAGIALLTSCQASGHSSSVSSMGSNAVLRYRAGAAEVIVRGFNQLQGLALRSDGSLLVSDEGLRAVMVVPPACLA
jgi:hypothetical protein